MHSTERRERNKIRQSVMAGINPSLRAARLRVDAREAGIHNRSLPSTDSGLAAMARKGRAMAAFE